MVHYFCLRKFRPGPLGTETNMSQDFSARRPWGAKINFWKGVWIFSFMKFLHMVFKFLLRVGGGALRLKFRESTVVGKGGGEKLMFEGQRWRTEVRRSCLYFLCVCIYLFPSHLYQISFQNKSASQNMQFSLKQQKISLKNAKALIN